MTHTGIFFGQKNDWVEFISGIYANFAMLGWGKEEVDNTELNILSEILRKVRNDKTDEENIVGNEINKEYKKAKERLEKWHKKNSG